MIQALIALSAMGVAPAAAADELERCIELWERLDREVITANYDGDPLEQVVDELSHQLAIPLRVDWKALDELALHRGSEVTLRVEFAHATSALRALAQSLGQTHRRPLVEPFGDQVVLTSPAGAAAMRLTACYDIRDLLGNEAVIDRLKRQLDGGDAAESGPASEPVPGGASDPAKNANDAAEEGPHRDGEGDDEDKSVDIEDDAGAAPPRPLTPGEKFAWLLTDHVEPDAWIQFGGNRASISERDGILIISAPPSTHLQVREALRRLRQVNPASILLDAAIVDLPRNAFQLLSRGHEAGSPAVAHAIFNGAESRILWRTTGVLAPGSPLSIESLSDGIAVTLDLDASLDETATNLLLSASATSAHGADRRSVKTTATFIEKRGSAIIELPAASQGDSVRMLVLLVRPG
jgi:hypothetical protein